MSTKVIVLGTYGGCVAPATLPTSRLLKIAGENSGNFMFQYATNKLIEADKVFVGESGVPYNDTSVWAGAKFQIMPAANHFRLGADWTGMCNYVDGCPMPLIVLGLGAQAPKESDEQETLQKLLADPHMQRLAETIRKKAVLVTVRGAFSKRVCEAFGIRNTLPIGCPSLLINPEPRLGARIQRLLDETRAKLRAGDMSPKVAITSASPFEIMNSYKLDLERVLFTVMKQHNGLYIQQSGGIDTVAISMRRFNEVKLAAAQSINRILDPQAALGEFVDHAASRFRIFWDVDTWIAGLRPIDVVIGTRLHGNMAALAADTPGVVITHDARTSELVDTMRLPHLRSEFLKPGATLLDLLDAVEFDGEEFDRNRREVANTFCTHIEQVGLHVADYARNLAGIPVGAPA